MTLSRRNALYVAGAAVLLAAAVVYALFDPSVNPFPRCIFLQATGYKCPGCGSQRALHALLHGDIAAAWGFNAMLVAAIPVVAAMYIAEIMRRRRPQLQPPERLCGYMERIRTARRVVDTQKHL